MQNNQGGHGMHPKIVIAGYPLLAKLAREVLKDLDVPDWIKIEISELPLQIIINRQKSFEKLSELLGPATILISGDRSALFFQSLVDNLVIPVKVTGFDFLEALQKVDSNEVYVINFHKNIDEITATANMLKVKVHQLHFHTIEEMEALLKLLKEQDVKEIIGGSWISHAAARYNMKGISYYSYRSMKEAITHAINTIIANKKDMEKSALYNTILDITRNGIIATDKEMKITIFNSAAEKLLQTKKNEVIGKNIRHLFPGIDLEKKYNKPERVLIQKGNKKIATEFTPVISGGKQYGIVSTLEDVEDIQETESVIRKQLNKKPLSAKYTFDQIVGTSEEILYAIDKAKKYSQTNSSILILGETGTGKEVFAQSIHNASSRRRYPFVAVNCAALPESLLDSELFGYEEGAFTGAKKGGKPGLFELAHRGTIFLDEISEMPYSLQSRLLRVLQEREVMRIGGNRNIPVDVRIITASNRDLRKCVENGEFREDLYYRISVLQLVLPSLRHRGEDIRLMVEHLLREKGMSVYIPYLNEDFWHVLYSYHWPGNVRELENVVERFIVSCHNQPVDADFVSLIQQALYPSSIRPFQQNTKTLNEEVEKLEGKMIIEVLKQCNGNREEAAKKLGISRTTLWRKINKLKDRDFTRV